MNIILTIILAIIGGALGAAVVNLIWHATTVNLIWDAMTKPEPSEPSSLEKALNNVRKVAPAEIEQAAIILMGTQAWACGITPDQMDAYTRISATRRISAEDLARLEQHGINTKPNLR